MPAVLSVTSMMLALTRAALPAAASTSSAISWVVAACWVTAAVMAPAISQMRPIVAPISLIMTTESSVAY